MSILALTEGALCAMFDPRGAGEANHVVLIGARLGDVIAHCVCLTGVTDTPRAALSFGDHSELTFNFRAREGPAIHFSLQALTLLTVLNPSVSTAISHLSTLMKTLTAQPRVALRATEQVNGWILTVAHHPPAHHQPSLT